MTGPTQRALTTTMRVLGVAGIAVGAAALLCVSGMPVPTAALDVGRRVATALVARSVAAHVSRSPSVASSLRRLRVRTVSSLADHLAPHHAWLARAPSLSHALVGYVRFAEVSPGLV